MHNLVQAISDFMWGPWTIILLAILGLTLTVASRGVQFRKFFTAIQFVMRGALRRDSGGETSGDITPFQALTTAMAATIGNGNIAGVATAIAVGGPGAAFWMAAIAPLGMATKFSETLLALRYRRKTQDGMMLGGPMSYLKEGLNLPTIGAIFAICATLGGLGGGNIGQANSIALSILFSPSKISPTSVLLIDLNSSSSKNSYDAVMRLVQDIVYHVRWCSMLHHLSERQRDKDVRAESPRF